MNWITVAAMKGGCGKTTTAIHLACAFAQHGRTLLLDADPQQSALRWWDLAELPFHASGVPSAASLHRQAPGLREIYDTVIVDTPASATVIQSAIRPADFVVVPVRSTLLDHNRLAAMVELVHDSDAVRLDGSPPYAVLLTSTRAGTRSRRQLRNSVLERGCPVFEVEIPLRERYASAGDRPVRDLGEYGLLAEEIASQLALPSLNGVPA